MEQVISFPGLGLEFTIDRVAFYLGEKPVYWYGVIIAAGVVLAILYACRNAKRFGITQDNVLDCLIFALPISIVTARLYYVLFSWDQYKDNLKEIVAIWHGGLAIYGGIIGAVLTVLVFARVKKIRFGDLMDDASLGLLIGQSIGRWGNFMNGEAHGGLTDGLLRMNIGETIAEAGPMGYHPTFLYESLWNAAGFVILHRISKKRRFSGETFLMYVAWYGLGRFVIEGMRTDSLYFFGTGIRISQLIGIVSFVAAGILIVYFRVRKKAEETA